MSVTDGFLCEFYNDLTLAHCDAVGSRPPQQLSSKAAIKRSLDRDWSRHHSIGTNHFDDLGHVRRTRRNFTVDRYGRKSTLVTSQAASRQLVPSNRR